MDTSTPDRDTLNGFKYLKTVLPLLARLHADGCDRDRGQNRQLHYDQYTALILLYFFNPIITSLRGLQDATTLRKVQHLLGVKKQRAGKRLKSIQVPAFHCCEQEHAFFFERAVRMTLRRWMAST